MHNPISKAPFLFLLIPLIIGIVFQYYNTNIIWSIIVAFIGSLIILLSYLIKKGKQYGFRWLFGGGSFFLFIALGSGVTYFKQQSLEYKLSDSIQTYVGYVIETPQVKPRSIAHKMYLEQEDISVVCYFQKDSARLPLQVGEQIIFKSQLQTFKNTGNLENFDYALYMYNQGFVASTYLPNYSWSSTGNFHHSLKISALQIRQKIMDFYESLGFSGDELAVISALTLGYQETLSDDLKQGFRATGTVHILAVSGLHVGIIFTIFSFLLSFISHSSRLYRLRLIVIILLLWIYAFITGLPPSVIRASTMLSLFCIANLFGNIKHSSLNSLYIAGFCMLLYNPFTLFDLGFQLSFVSVLSILLLYKRMAGLTGFSNKLVNYFWQLFCLSAVAQLGAFPLCLYYFGTFPSYFFIANLVIVPLVSLIIYGVVCICVLFVICSTILPMFNDLLYWLPINIVTLLVKAMNIAVRFIHDLPFALIENVSLSFIQLILIFSTITTLLFAGIKYSSKSLILSLVLALSFIITRFDNNLKSENNQLIVYNRNGQVDIRTQVNNQQFLLDSLIFNFRNPVIELGRLKILLLNSELDSDMETSSLYNVDWAIVLGDTNYSLATIEERYNVSEIVLDSSLQTHIREQLTKECENRNIPIYDVTKKGAFSINF